MTTSSLERMDSGILVVVVPLIYLYNIILFATRWLSAIVYLVFLFLVVVVLLNLLIAQMSNSYESVLQKAHISVTWNRAKLLRRLWKSPWMKAFVEYCHTHDTIVYLH